MDHTSPGRPLVSVVMCVLNPHPVYFAEAVRSILAQTLGKFEFIIVEDPSPRRAQDTLAAFDDPRIRHYRNVERTSLIRQRNQGLALARADLVAVFDADDISEPTRLEQQFNFLRAHADVDVLGTQIAVIDRHRMVQGHRRFP